MRCVAKSLDLVDAVRSLAARGMLATEIAAALGEKPGWVRAAAVRHGITMRVATRAEICAMGVRSRPSPARRLRVPDWVPADLVGEYRDHRAECGAAWAEQVVRRLMSGAI